MQINAEQARRDHGRDRRTRARAGPGRTSTRHRTRWRRSSSSMREEIRTDEDDRHEALLEELPGVDARTPEVPDLPRGAEAEGRADRATCRRSCRTSTSWRSRRRTRSSIPPSITEPTVPVRPKRAAEHRAGHDPELRPGDRPGLPAGAPRPLGQGPRAPVDGPDPAALRRDPPDPADGADPPGRAISGRPARPSRSRPTPTATSAPACSGRPTSTARS